MIKFAHVRPQGSDNRQGGYTIAFQKLEDQNEIVFAVARCNAKDNFNKAIGRSIAEGRLHAGQNVSVSTRAKKYGTILGKIIPLVESYIALARKASKNRKK